MKFEIRRCYGHPADAYMVGRVFDENEPDFCYNMDIWLKDGDSMFGYTYGNTTAKTFINHANGRITIAIYFLDKKLIGRGFLNGHKVYGKIHTVKRFNKN